MLPGIREIQRFLISLEEEKGNTLLKDQNELWGEEEGEGGEKSNPEVDSQGGAFSVSFAFLFLFYFSIRLFFTVIFFGNF